jgi:hypothetical protein
MSDAILTVSFLLISVGGLLMNRQIRLTNQRIDLLWDYARSLSRSHETQGRINDLIAAKIGLFDNDTEPAGRTTEPTARVIEDLDPDSPFDQDPEYVAMRHEAIRMAFESGRPVVGDANGIRFADEQEQN